jgi:chromosomal replication initiation ATPase DnaA
MEEKYDVTIKLTAKELEVIVAKFEANVKEEAELYNKLKKELDTVNRIIEVNDINATIKDLIEKNPELMKDIKEVCVNIFTNLLLKKYK